MLSVAVISSCSDNENDISTPDVTLSQQEIDDLIFLREEEKLARDVYLFSYDTYGIDIFNNIAGSEQQHMNSLLTLINLYGLSDPASSERGVFTNEVLQGLYNDLTEQSSISLLEALIVGATIEDLDISDIDEFESRTDKEDILSVYSKLKCGSRNHIRNYTSQIEDNGESYAPQFLSVEELTEILSASNERCGW